MHEQAQDKPNLNQELTFHIMSLINSDYFKSLSYEEVG